MNIVCSDTYVDAFSRLDRKIQKKSLETIRHMQRGLKSNGLKVEKLDTKLDFKSVRITQDFRAIFTQAGNTILLVYIGHHDTAYLWASNRLQGFDAAGARPACEYFEQSKAAWNPLPNEAIEASGSTQSSQNLQNEISDLRTGASHASERPINRQTCSAAGKDTPVVDMRSESGLFKKFIFALIFFCLGAFAGIMITIEHFEWLYNVFK